MINPKYHYDITRKNLEDIRNYQYIWHPRNFVSVYFRHAQEIALIKGLNKINLHLDNKKILDIGCGKGRFLRWLVETGADSNNCYGIDLSAYRIQEAKKKNPLINFVAASGERLPFPDETFDIATQFTTFSSMGEENVREKTSAEINRVLKKGGIFIWYDMCYVRKNKDNFPVPIKMETIKKYFPKYRIIYCQKLHSLLASKIAPLSFMTARVIDKILPIFKTNILTFLKKND